MWRRRRSVQAEIPLGKEEPAFDAVSNRYLASPGSKQLFQRAAAIKARERTRHRPGKPTTYYLRKSVAIALPLEYL